MAPKRKVDDLFEEAKHAGIVDAATRDLSDFEPKKLLSLGSGVTSLHTLLKESNERNRKKAAAEQARAQAQAIAAAAADKENVLHEEEGAEAHDPLGESGETDEPTVQEHVLTWPKERCTWDDGAALATCSKLYRAALPGQGSAGVSSLPDEVLGRELLLQGWLGHFLKQQAACPAGLLAALFEILAYSQDQKVSTAAFGCIASLIDDGLEITAEHKATESLIYTRRKSVCTIADMVDDSAFKKALRTHGLCLPASSQRGSKASGAAAVEGSTPALSNLQLVLRCLALVALHQQAYGGALTGGGLCELVLAVAHLHLDPAGQLLAPDLDATLRALLAAFQERDWDLKHERLATDLAALGPSHRAHLVLLRALPATSSPRAARLQALGAAALLASLCQPKQTKGRAGGGGAKRTARSGIIHASECSAEEVLESCCWFGDSFFTGCGATNMGAHVAKVLLDTALKADAAFDVSEVETAIHTAELLIWSQVKASRSTGTGPSLSPAFVRKYRNFLSTIASQLKHAQTRMLSRMRIDSIVLHDRNDMLAAQQCV